MKTVFIKNRMYKTIDVSVNGTVSKVNIKNEENGVIGAMFVFDKIPQGANKDDYTDAEV